MTPALDSDELVRLIQQKSTGLSGTVNEWPDTAPGEFIVFLNSDDILKPNAIDIEVQAVLKAGDFDIVKGCVRFFTMDPDGNRQMLQETQVSPYKTMDLLDLMVDIPAINARFLGGSDCH